MTSAEVMTSNEVDPSDKYSVFKTNNNDTSSTSDMNISSKPPMLTVEVNSTSSEFTDFASFNVTEKNANTKVYSNHIKSFVTPVTPNNSVNDFVNHDYSQNQIRIDPNQINNALNNTVNISNDQGFADFSGFITGTSDNSTAFSNSIPPITSSSQPTAEFADFASFPLPNQEDNTFLSQTQKTANVPQFEPQANFQSNPSTPNFNMFSSQPQQFSNMSEPQPQTQPQQFPNMSQPQPQQFPKLSQPQPQQFSNMSQPQPQQFPNMSQPQPQTQLHQTNFNMFPPQPQQFPNVSHAQPQSHPQKTDFNMFPPQPQQFPNVSQAPPQAQTKQQSTDFNMFPSHPQKPYNQPQQHYNQPQQPYNQPQQQNFNQFQHQPNNFNNSLPPSQQNVPVSQINNYQQSNQSSTQNNFNQTLPNNNIQYPRLSNNMLAQGQYQQYPGQFHSNAPNVYQQPNQQNFNQGQFNQGYSNNQANFGPRTRPQQPQVRYKAHAGPDPFASLSLKSNAEQLSLKMSGKTFTQNKSEKKRLNDMPTKIL